MSDGRPAVTVLDAEALAAALERFGGTDAERRVVARQARDLSESSRIVEDRGAPLTGSEVVSTLEEAPDGGPAARWNWWMGALSLAYGGYDRFRVDRTEDDGDANRQV